MFKAHRTDTISGLCAVLPEKLFVQSLGYKLLDHAGICFSLRGFHALTNKIAESIGLSVFVVVYGFFVCCKDIIDQLLNKIRVGVLSKSELFDNFGRLSALVYDDRSHLLSRRSRDLSDFNG